MGVIYAGVFVSASRAAQHMFVFRPQISERDRRQNAVENEAKGRETLEESEVRGKRGRRDVGD